MPWVPQKCVRRTGRNNTTGGKEKKFQRATLPIVAPTCASPLVVCHRASFGFDLERVRTVDLAGLRVWMPLPYTIWPRLSPVKW